MVSVEEDVQWLIRAEKRAEVLYRRAQALFKDDPALSPLLGELAADEEAHHRMLLGLTESTGIIRLLPEGTVERQETDDALSSLEKRLSAGDIGRAELMEAVAALEFSEHNETFIYMVNALRGFPQEFSDLLALLAAHRDRITAFLNGAPEYSRALALTRTIPRLTNGRDILVVEDDETIAGLFQVFLAEEGTIDRAANGKEALSMLEKKNYSAIISDVDMPVMNGIDLFRNAVERFNGIGKKFLFLTGSFEEEYLTYFENKGIRYLFKPLSMREVKTALSIILHDKA